MLRSSSVLFQRGSTQCGAPQPVARNQKLKHPRRRPCPWEAAVVAAVCLTRVMPPLRKWQRVRTQAWSAHHLTPNPHPQMGVFLWMDVVEAEERDCWDQCGTIPVTAMRDVPHGDQDTGRAEIMEITERESMEVGGDKSEGVKWSWQLFTVYLYLPNLRLLAIQMMKVSFKMVRHTRTWLLWPQENTNDS